MKDYCKKLINYCSKKNMNISLAESCTGGMIASKLISVSGASKVIDLGLITYSNKSKNLLLNIDLKYIEKHGAVSDKVAELMVKGLSKISKSDICLSVTGIAGPKGGTMKKPVGLVYHGFYFKKQNKTLTVKKQYYGTRTKIRREASQFSVYFVSTYLNLSI